MFKASSRRLWQGFSYFISFRKQFDLFATLRWLLVWQYRPRWQQTLLSGYVFNVTRARYSCRIWEVTLSIHRCGAPDRNRTAHRKSEQSKATHSGLIIGGRVRQRSHHRGDIGIVLHGEDFQSYMSHIWNTNSNSLKCHRVSSCMACDRLVSC